MTLDEIQRYLASKVESEAVAPVFATDDWNLRRDLINEAQRDWANRYDWESLRATQTTSAVAGSASYALPANFNKMERYVVLGGLNYAEVEPIEAAYMSSNSNRYFHVLGNPDSGYALNINPTPTSGPTIMTYAYYKDPADMSTASSTSPVPNPFFLVQSAYARLLELDEDQRFPQAKAEAEAILMQMLENEFMSRGPSLKERRRIRTRQKMAEILRKTAGSISPVKRQEKKMTLEQIQQRLGA